VKLTPPPTARFDAVAERLPEEGDAVERRVLGPVDDAVLEAADRKERLSRQRNGQAEIEPAGELVLETAAVGDAELSAPALAEQPAEADIETGRLAVARDIFDERDRDFLDLAAAETADLAEQRCTDVSGLSTDGRRQRQQHHDC
jgi:hypothetical protein